ncbi:MAG: hypothetical protein ACJ788_10120 [Ktedonobacteraceae bacterium]
MAEASSATTNHGGSATLVWKPWGLFTAQQHEPHPNIIGGLSMSQDMWKLTPPLF